MLLPLHGTNHCTTLKSATALRPSVGLAYDMEHRICNSAARPGVTCDGCFAVFANALRVAHVSSLRRASDVSGDLQLFDAPEQRFTLTRVLGDSICQFLAQTLCFGGRFGISRRLFELGL